MIPAARSEVMVIMWRFKIPYCTFLTFYESSVKYSSFSGTEVESLVYSIWRKLGGRKNIVAELSHTFEVSGWKVELQSVEPCNEIVTFLIEDYLVEPNNCRLVGSHDGQFQGPW